MNDYEISTDPARLDRDLIHRWLAEESYWARGRTRAVMEQAIDSSLNFGAYAGGGAQVGYARAVTDRCTFAWLCDVFVLDAHRGRGLGAELVRAALEHPGLATVRAWHLATLDAHGLYRRFGFEDPDDRLLVLRRHSPAAGLVVE